MRTDNARSNARPPVHNAGGMSSCLRIIFTNGHARGTAAVTVDGCRSFPFSASRLSRTSTSSTYPRTCSGVMIRHPRLSVAINNVAVMLGVCGLVHSLRTVKQLNRFIPPHLPLSAVSIGLPRFSSRMNSATKCLSPSAPCRPSLPSHSFIDEL